jgi:hypothetical protein
MGLAELALVNAPHGKSKLIVDCTYRRTRFNPTRDKGRPIAAKFAYSMAAHLLKLDAGHSEQEIASQLECSESQAKTFVEYGAHVVNRSGEAQELLATIRDDVHSRLEKVGMQFMLDSVDMEPPPPAILEIPDEVPKIIALVARILGVPPGLMVGNTKRFPEMHARHIAVAIVQFKKPAMSRPKIGSYFGKRDNTTILSSLQKIDRIVRGEDDDPVLFKKIEHVREKLGLDISAFYFVPKKPA